MNILWADYRYACTPVRCSYAVLDYIYGSWTCILYMQFDQAARSKICVMGEEDSDGYFPGRISTMVTCAVVSVTFANMAGLPEGGRAVWIGHSERVEISERTKQDFGMETALVRLLTYTLFGP